MFEFEYVILEYFFLPKLLIHWGRLTHICISKLTTIDSDNGLSPGRRQAIIWINAGILLIGPFGTNFSEILSKIYTFSFKKVHVKMSSEKWRPSCLGLNVLKDQSLYAGQCDPPSSCGQILHLLLVSHNSHVDWSAHHSFPQTIQCQPWHVPVSGRHCTKHHQTSSQKYCSHGRSGNQYFQWNSRLQVCVPMSDYLTH